MKQSDIDALNELIDSIKSRYEEIKCEAEKDLEIDEFDLDTSLLAIPKLHGKWLDRFTENTIFLKDLYSLKEKTKLERWKYYQGKQTDKYYAENGIVHEKILKTDLDKYLSADEKIKMVNDACTHQKALTDYIEKVMKEISNRNFHIRAIIDWRKFTNGVN
jgi:hypothetical protein